MSTQLQIKRGTAAALSLVNPTLAAGEWCYETDTLQYKIGDGVNDWNTLSYAGNRFDTSFSISSSGNITTVSSNATTSRNIALPDDDGTLSLDGHTHSTNDISNVVITPSQITSDQNDYNPGTGNIVRLSSDAARNITGLVAGSDGQIKLLQNVGSFLITLKHENASSAETNRFTVPWAGDCIIAADYSVLIVYDATTNRWRIA